MKKYFVTIWEESNKIAWVYKIAASKEDAELAAEFAFIARYPNIKFTHAVAEETAEETTEPTTEPEEEKENEPMTTTYNITYNAQYDSYEVTFESKPATAILDALKALKMRWNPKKACWYGFAKEHEIINAILENGEGETITGEKTEGATVYTDGYLGGGAVYGSKSNLHLYGADLSKAIREDIKRAGIKGVTVRCKSYSGGQSIGVTVTLRPDEYISFPEFLENYRIKGNTWIYTAENPSGIQSDRYFEMSAEEQQETRAAAAAYDYERMTTRENRVNEFYIDEETHFTPETLAKIKNIQAIICAYRYDESNGMVDYFNTNFYYDIYTKPAAVKPTTPDDEPTKPAKDEPKEEPAAEETAPVQPAEQAQEAETVVKTAESPEVVYVVDNNGHDIVTRHLDGINYEVTFREDGKPLGNPEVFTIDSIMFVYGIDVTAPPVEPTETASEPQQPENALDIAYTANLRRVYENTLSRMANNEYYGSETENGIKMALEYLEPMPEILTEDQINHAMRLAMCRRNSSDQPTPEPTPKTKKEILTAIFEDQIERGTMIGVIDDIGEYAEYKAQELSVRECREWYNAAFNEAALPKTDYSETINKAKSALIHGGYDCAGVTISHRTNKREFTVIRYSVCGADEVVDKLTALNIIGQIHAADGISFEAYAEVVPADFVDEKRAESAGDTPEEVPETAEPMPEPIKPSPIREDLARRAHDMMSYSDYREGSATAEYNTLCDRAEALAEEQKRKVDPMYHDKIDALVSSYKRRMADNINRRNEIGTRCPSVLVAGPANFPVKKKLKQNAASDRNMEEYNEIQRILDKIRSTGTGGITTDDPNAREKIDKKIEALEALQNTMKAVNAYYRKHGTLDGCPDITPDQALTLAAGMERDWRSDPKPFEAYQLSNNNAEIHRLRARLSELDKLSANTEAGWTFDGGTVEICREDNRVRIFHDSKPDADVISELKSHGFKWARSVGAWQRQLTENAINAARQITT